ncbi:hypothetical protein DPV78_007844 [Talaromyces pinophilus]|nr:hypothetical protein DPV78_007844 [Talaromyces pinophilus]
MASADRPEILLLCLAYQEFLDESYASLIDKLADSANVKRAKSAAGAIRYLAANNPKAIIITDEGITEKENEAALQKMGRFDYLFGRVFNLPWRHGDYHRTTFQANPSCTLPDGVGLSSMPGPYSMKVLHIKNARPQEKIFVPVSAAMTQSIALPPSHVDETQAATTGAKIEDGYLVYCGDVNPGDELDQTILALCSLRA